MNKKNKYIKTKKVKKLNPFELMMIAGKLDLPLDIAKEANNEERDLNEVAAEYHKKA